MKPESPERRGGLHPLQTELLNLDLSDFNACEYFKDRLPKWHDLKPDIVVIAPQTATVYQPLIKRALTRAYGNNDCPKFVNIDPNSLPVAGNPEKILNDRTIFESKPRVLIFDDTSNLLAETPRPIRYNFVAEPQAGQDPNKPRSLQKLGSYIQSLGTEEIWLDWADWGRPLSEYGAHALIRRQHTPEGTKLTRQSAEKRPVALDLAKKMRKLGDLVGELIEKKIP